MKVVDPYAMRFWLLGMSAFGSLWIEKFAGLGSIK